MSELISAKIYSAFLKAQGEFPVIPKDSEVSVKDKNGRFLYSYKYADLTTIIDKTRPALSKYELGFTQNIQKDDKLGLGIFTRFIHSSGETFDSGFVPCEIKNTDMKLVAGLFTYAKRISLTAALGISADEDMDSASDEGQQGNSTTKSPQNSQQKNEKPKQGGYVPPVKNHAPQNSIDAQIGTMFKAYNSKGVSNQDILAYFNYENEKQITQKDVDNLRNIWKDLASGQLSVHDLFLPPVLNEPLDFAPFEDSDVAPIDDFDRHLQEQEDNPIERIARERGIRT